MSTIFTFLDDEPTIAQLGAGGGVPSPIQIAQKTLTNAQVITLQDTPFEIIPAPGTNKVIMFLGAFVSTSITSAYTGINAAAQMAFYLGNGDVIVSTELFEGDSVSGVSNILAASGASIFFQYSQKESGILVANNMTEGGGLASLFVNAKLVLGASNGGLDYTGGNAANTLKATVIYCVLSI